MQRLTEARIRRAFAQVFHVVLAAGAGAVVATTGSACGGATEGEPGGGGITPDFTSLCGASEKSFLQGLHATPELDGAEMRQESAFAPKIIDGQQQGGVVPLPPGAEGDHWQGTSYEVTGMLCAKATNGPACNEKVQGYRVLPNTEAACEAAYSAGSYARVGCMTEYILYTRGDEIAVARTNEEITALIGTFDTPEEALWAAKAAGYQTSCGEGAQGIPDSQYRTTTDGGYDLKLVKYDNCGETGLGVTLHVDYAGVVTVTSSSVLPARPPCAVAGRRPEGLRMDRLATRGAGPIGEHFASVAILEAASVTAFRRLHRELAACGAPRALLDRIRVAARDEVRHARAITALAEKYGVTPAPPEVTPPEGLRTLFEIALENAREGCVRETYGALVAHLQASQADDADVRDAMSVIANEETEHAALSWDIAAWMETQLGETERAALVEERRAAVATLAHDLEREGDAAALAASGMPSASLALLMLSALTPELLAA
ncbi:MAG: ferritin-like domain-containing protein [Polyangiaceae bacterium]